MKYWYEQGKHQRIYRRLQDALVPDEGEAATEAGEIIRAIGNATRIATSSSPAISMAAAIFTK